MRVRRLLIDEFTTLNLGVADADDGRIFTADIPG